MVDSSILGVIERLGFVDILLWLLSFAVVYGVLSMVNIPKQKTVQGIIAIVLAFMTLMAVPKSLIETLSGMSTALIVVVLGILVFVVLIEAAGMKHYKKTKGEAEIEGKRVMAPGFEELSLFSSHKEIIAAAIILIVALIFVGAGGLKIIGLDLNVDITGVAFLIMIILALLWMIKG